MNRPERILLAALCTTLTACNCTPGTGSADEPAAPDLGAGGGAGPVGGGGGGPSTSLGTGGGTGGAGGVSGVGGGGGRSQAVERCTPGAADGCCPASARGQSDPDCGSLQCSSWRVGAPIPLDAPTVNGGGQAPLFWTGDELVIGLQQRVWTDAGTPGQLALQWRTPAGLVREAGPLELNPNWWPAFGTAGIDVDPATGDVFFAYLSNQNVGIDGARAWVARASLDAGSVWSAPLGIYCNAIRGEGRPQPFLSGDRLVVGFGEHACSAATGASTRAYWFDARTGDVLPEASGVFEVNDGVGGAKGIVGSGGFALERPTGLLHQVYGRWGDHDLRWRTLDPRPPTPTASTPETRALPTSHLWTHMPAAAFSGRELGIASMEIAYGSLQAPRLTVRVGAPDAGLSAQPTVLATHDHYDMRTPPHIEGTGFGFAVLDTWGPRTVQSTGVPEAAEYVTMVHHVGAQGQLLESFPLDGPGALYPDVVWAGGRLAITWVRAFSGGPMGTEYQHFLRWIDCP